MTVCTYTYVYQIGVSWSEIAHVVEYRHFRSPLFAEFLTHCVLNGATKRRKLPRYQSEEMKILNISLRRVGIEPTTITFMLMNHGSLYYSTAIQLD